MLGLRWNVRKVGAVVGFPNTPMWPCGSARLAASGGYCGRSSCPGAASGLLGPLLLRPQQRRLPCEVRGVEHFQRCRDCAGQDTWNERDRECGEKGQHEGGRQHLRGKTEVRFVDAVVCPPVDFV